MEHQTAYLSSNLAFTQKSFSFLKDLWQKKKKDNMQQQIVIQASSTVLAQSIKNITASTAQATVVSFS